MKTLTKIRLINWHYFSNVTADIKNITFLTGPNGTGKSTIIDALQVIILGSTRPDNFNKAANEKGRSGRSLLSYLRGQTGVKDDGSVVNLRAGTFTSYIACEFYDDVQNQAFTLGVCFDVENSDKIDKHYFYLDGSFPANGFTNNETETNKSKVRPLQYRELSSYVRENYKVNHFRFFDTDTDYQKFSKEMFGNLPDKYFALFKKAVSFSPISNISSFITEYICDADLKVDITPMQKNIEQYKILESEAKNLKTKVEALQQIKATYDELRSYDGRMALLNYVTARVSFEENKKKLDFLNERLKKDNDRLLLIGDEIHRIDIQLDDINKDLNSYNAKVLQSDNYSLTEKLIAKKEGLEKQISAIQMQVSTVTSALKEYALSYSKTCLSFSQYYSDFDSSKLGNDISRDFDELVELCHDIGFSAKSVLEMIDNGDIQFDQVKSFQNDMEMLRTKATTVRSELNSVFYQVSSQLQTLQSDLTAVNSGKKPFDKLGPTYLEVKRSLETQLKARHSDAYVNIFCDLIDVNDPEWTMALEAVLYNQKFNFFVNPRYYEEANRILKQLCDTYHYYHVSLVDTERLLSNNIVANSDSVANLIDTQDEGARAYTDYILGRIRKCTTFEEARKSGSGLLSDCTGYRGYATWYLNKGNARIFYIGTSVSNNAKAVSSADYQEMNRKYSLISEALNKIATLLTLSVMSVNEYQTYSDDMLRINEISGIQDQINALDLEMKQVAKGDMSAIEKKIEELKGQVSELTSRRNDLLTERGQILADTNRLNGEEIPSATANVNDSRKQLESYDADEVNNSYEPFFSKLLDEQGLSFAQIRNEAYRETVQASNKISHARAVLSKYRNDYCAEYHLNYDTTNEQSNEEFDKELENISKVMLPDYEEKIAKAHEDSVREFKDDFIYKLRTAIDTVYAQIEDLNAALNGNSFGRDSYQFKVSPNKDYLEYYNMIMDPLLLKAGDAENLFMAKYKTTMNDLFGLISSSTSASGEAREQVLRNIQTFTTYTTYIIFDLLVTRGVGENLQTISLGRSFSSQSGGETQTPFYIAILASFAQLCRVNNRNDSNTLRLVIFDEAFSKMDSARIMKSTDLLRQFGLQSILSTPSEKLRDLVAYVDQILVTMHEDKKKRSYIDVYQEKSKRLASAKQSEQPSSDETVISEKTE